MDSTVKRLVNGTSTTSKRSLWPPSTADLYAVDCHESRLKLSNMQWMDDWAMALSAVTLGYSSAASALPAVSLPWVQEAELAEELCDALELEALRFFKSGSDALSCAVRLARAYTERDRVIVFDKSYHGTGDWFGPGIWTPAGYTQQDTYVYPFGKRFDNTLFQGVAAIIVEPVPKGVLLPPDGWLQHLREVCNEHGILLISDEVILGYRHSLRGYMDSLGIRADLACYGKALAQGTALSCVGGSADVMGLLQDRVHFSGTNNGEPGPLAVSRATLRRYQAEDICQQLAWKGIELQMLLGNEGFTTKGLTQRFEVLFADDDAKHSAVAYCFDHGILFPGFCSMATTHTTEQTQRLVSVLSDWRQHYGTRP